MPVLSRVVAYTEEQLVVLQSDDPEEFLRTSELIATFGGRVSQVYGPRVLLAQMPVRQHEAFTQALETSHAAGEEGTANAPFPVSEGEALGIAAWRLRSDPQFAEAKARRPGRDASWGMDPPDEPEEDAEASGEEEFASPAPDLSSFLIGSVAVGLIIVEGPTPDLQFTQAERELVVAEVQDGLGWLAAQEPRAGVTWVFDLQVLRVAVPADTSLPMTYEAREAPWRDPALHQLGHGPGIQGVRDYVSALIGRLGTRWGYAGFFTKYPLKHFAYASKPRVVMHYGNNGWKPEGIAEVFTHETGHIFGCPDEYKESKCSCSSRHGPFNEVNGNCERCATPFTPCLMAANTRALCTYTRAHLGWRDSDGDGTLDLAGE
jgi:hypothetical protein